MSVPQCAPLPLAGASRFPLWGKMQVTRASLFFIIPLRGKRLALGERWGVYSPRPLNPVATR
jgi:hypothetical protein